jgi:glyoxylase-like metal-dependent hydrolase (beta-lactamase superfamily II)
MQMTEHITIDDTAIADIDTEGPTQTTAGDIAYHRLLIVNVIFIGTPESNEWVLVDAGIPGSASFIKRAARERYGEDRPPVAIVMTHGPFDHAGALESLATDWDVPIYAHPLEMPYLDGTSAYPAPDPSVGGGLMSLLSPLYPRGPYDVRQWLLPLPAVGCVPALPGWRWIHVPGHTPGQIALWRAADRSLIAGDAFITTDQESAYAVALQKTEIQGPPMYFTTDWEAARTSVHTLAALEPELAVTGHGHAIHGPELQAGLRTLDEQFDRIAVPKHGRYVPDGDSTNG